MYTFSPTSTHCMQHQEFKAAAGMAGRADGLAHTPVLGRHQSTSPLSLFHGIHNASHHVLEDEYAHAAVHQAPSDDRQVSTVAVESDAPLRLHKGGAPLLVSRCTCPGRTQAAYLHTHMHMQERESLHHRFCLTEDRIGKLNHNGHCLQAHHSYGTHAAPASPAPALPAPEPAPEPTTMSLQLLKP